MEDQSSCQIQYFSDQWFIIFYITDTMDLDLRSSGPKLSSGLPLEPTNHLAKYEVFVTNGLWQIEQKIMTPMNLPPLTQKIKIGFQLKSIGRLVKWSQNTFISEQFAHKKDILNMCKNMDVVRYFT